MLLLYVNIHTCIYTHVCVLFYLGEGYDSLVPTMGYHLVTRRIKLKVSFDLKMELIEWIWGENNGKKIRKEIVKNKEKSYKNYDRSNW